MPARYIVTVHLFGRGVPYERARRICLERLLYELDQARVALACVESRTAEMDHHDLLLVMGIRKARVLSRKLTVTWQQPTQEPLLWAADAVAGATTWWLDGKPGYLEILSNKTQMICLE